MGDYHEYPYKMILDELKNNTKPESEYVSFYDYFDLDESFAQYFYQFERTYWTLGLLSMALSLIVLPVVFTLDSEEGSKPSGSGPHL